MTNRQFWDLFRSFLKKSLDFVIFSSYIWYMITKKILIIVLTFQVLGAVRVKKPKIFPKTVKKTLTIT